MAMFLGKSLFQDPRIVTYWQIACQILKWDTQIISFFHEEAPSEIQMDYHMIIVVLNRSCQPWCLEFGEGLPNTPVLLCKTGCCDVYSIYVES